jgi:hypothetical protein
MLFPVEVLLDHTLQEKYLVKGGFFTKTVPSKVSCVERKVTIRG